MSIDKSNLSEVRLEHANSVDGKEWTEAIEEKAKEAQATEHSLSTFEAVKAYPMAIFWSLMVSRCVVMEGYDTIL